MPAESHADAYSQQYHTKNNSTGGNDSRATYLNYFLKTKLQTKSKQQEDNTNVRPCLNIGGIHH